MSSMSEKQLPESKPASGKVSVSRVSNTDVTVSKKFRTISDVEIKRLYTAEDVDQSALAEKLGEPGSPPYTRGIHRDMYRSRVWTMRQFAGMGNARQTNERYHYLLAQKTGGLSVAFDLPTLMGYDSDQSHSLGEVGKCGVAIDTLADFEVLFEGIALDRVSTSMTINSPASILFAMYLALAEKQGIGCGALCKMTFSKSILRRRNGFTHRDHRCG